MVIPFDETVANRLRRLDPDGDLDSAHDAWLELQRVDDAGGHDGPTRALFFRTKRRGIDERRRRKLGQPDALARCVPIDHSLPNVECRLIQTEDLDRVTAAVHSLPQRYRTALLLKYWRGWSPTKIAKYLGLPLKTVYSRLARARAILSLELID